MIDRGQLGSVLVPSHATGIMLMPSMRWPYCVDVACASCGGFASHMFKPAAVLHERVLCNLL